MIQFRCAIIALSSALLLSCGGTDKKSADTKNVIIDDKSSEGFSYPETRREEVVDTYHGTEVIDAYRWLEDDNSKETAAWVVEQNKVSFGYLETIPERKTIADRITKLWDYEKFGTPYKKAGRYFYFRNDGLQDHSVLYWAESLEAEPKVLLDPNAFSKDGIWDSKGRERLGRVACPQRRHGERPRRQTRLHQVLRSELGSQERRFLLRPLSQAKRRRRANRGQLQSESLLSQGWHASERRPIGL
jgi:hypothetical protein